MDCELLKRLYLEEDFNCAEATLMAMDRELDLGIKDDDMKLIGAFGGGMGCGEVCGALCAAMAIIGRVKIEQRAHATLDLKTECAQFVMRFKDKMGGLECRTIKPRNTVEGQRCFKTVIENYELLEDFLKDN